MLSVLMTTYNAGRTLRRALTGLIKVLDELSIKYEVVAVDNESRDDTVEVLREFGVRYKVMKCTRGLGRHQAVLMSSGDYLLFYDADAYAVHDLLYNFLNISINKYRTDFSLAHTGVYVMTRKCYEKTGGFMNLNVGEDIHLWARAFLMCKSKYYPLRVACNAPRLYAVRGYRGEMRYSGNILNFIFREVKNETHRLRGLALRPREIIVNMLRGNDPFLMAGSLVLGPLSPLLSNSISKTMSNLELVYWSELRSMGSIEEVSDDHKYIIQDIFFVNNWEKIYLKFYKLLSKYDVNVIRHKYARIIYTQPSIDLCPPP